MKVFVLGGINEDVVAYVDDLPRRGETVAARGLHRSAGGKGLNQAVAASRFGGAVTMLGAIGNDAAGAFLRATLQEAKVADTHVLAHDGVATGQALICLAADGDNTIVVNAGANAHFGSAEIEAAAPDVPAVFLTQFEAMLPAIEALFRLPAARDGVRILNTAPALDEGAHLLPLADILILNETELQRFARLPTPPEGREEVLAAVRALGSRSGQKAIVTLGAAGCVLVDGPRVVHFPAFPAVPVDTIGAGDCFCGVLATALAEGAVIDDAIRSASAAAALSVQRSGAASSSPFRQEVEALLNKAVDAVAFVPE